MMMENLLLKKLQVKSNFKVSIVNAPENAAAIFGDIPLDVEWTYETIQKADVYLVFAITKADMLAALALITTSINDKTIVWIVYPKAKTALASDLNLMQSWQDLTIFNLAPCASAAISPIWTAIRVKTTASQKKSGLGNTEIVNSEYGKYIDVASKTVTLPSYLKAMLAAHPEALTYYEQLAYSHKKEYVLWIISAKQEKTRIDRMNKMLTMLLAGKKNPTVK